jgi:molybdopterin molybdotransferase
MKELIDCQEATKRIFENLPVLSAEHCPLGKAAGRTLREPIRSDRPFPPFDRVMMDGFALRARDLSSVKDFRVVAQAPAGAAPVTRPLETGEAIEVMTGAVVPLHADTIIPYEDTEPAAAGFRVRVPDDHQAGDAIHPKGSDHPAGEELVGAGCRINCHVAAVAATCGYTTVSVSREPLIAILCTGDELVPVEEQPLAHQIRRSNDAAIHTALTQAGFTAATCAHIPDDPEASHRILESFLSSHDVILITGGVSMGKRDHIPDTLRQLGAACHFHGVRQKPGKPFAYWTKPGRAVFALPGNPLSVLACLHHHVIPALRKTLGQSPDPDPIVELAETIPAHRGLTRFLPVQIKPGGQARPCPPGNSGDLVRILQSDGYIVLPEGASAEEGSHHAFHPWH